MGRAVQSMENRQLLRDPLAGVHHPYLSIDVAERGAAGDERRVFESEWETFLAVADDPAELWGPGDSYSGAIGYDSGGARDCNKY